MDEMEWNVMQEGQLLDAMVGYKPVGISKNFQMFLIWDKLTDIMKKHIEPDAIWKHLTTMYNLEALDEADDLPFPNADTEFNLPDLEFEPYKTKKLEIVVVEEQRAKSTNTPKGRETPKIVKELKKEERVTPNRSTKEMPRRDSKDSKESKNTSSSNSNSSGSSVKREVKKEPEKGKVIKGRNSVTAGKEESKSGKGKSEETPKIVKRPTRGSLKPDDVVSSGKASPQNVTPVAKRRRI